MAVDTFARDLAAAALANGGGGGTSGVTEEEVKELIDENVAMYPEAIVCIHDVTTANTSVTMQNITPTKVIWGDGTTDTNLTHTYTDVGLYTCLIFGVTQLGNNVFYNNAVLQHIKFPDTVTSTGSMVLANCPKLISAVLGNGISEQALGAYTFYNDTNLERVVFPPQPLSIPDSTFQGCYYLDTIDIPGTVTSIGYSTFSGCYHLLELNLPDVAYIYSGAFAGCASLKRITIKTATPPSLPNVSAFNNTNNCPIYVPAESLEAYKTATNWSALADRLVGIATTTYVDNAIASAGGSTLYRHDVIIGDNGGGKLYFHLYSGSATAFTFSTFINSDHIGDMFIAVGYPNSEAKCIGGIFSIDEENNTFEVIVSGTTGVGTMTVEEGDVIVTDNVTQL